MTIQLDSMQEHLYIDGGWSYDALLRDLNEQLDARGIHEPVAVMAADGMRCLFWLTAERR